MRGSARFRLLGWSAVFVVGIAGCAEPSAAPVIRAQVQDPAALQLLHRMFDAAGGWAAWQELQTVAFDMTVIAFNEAHQVADTFNETHWLRPHELTIRIEQSQRGRRLGYNAGALWARTTDGRPLTDAAVLAEGRFATLATHYWFGLPFKLADPGCVIRYAGEERAPEGRVFDKLEVTYAPGTGDTPQDWYVYYVDRETGLIGQILFTMTAEGHGGVMLLAEWLEHWPVGGMRLAHHRVFYRADHAGHRLSEPILEERLANVRVNPAVPEGWWSGP